LEEADLIMSNHSTP